MEVTRRDAIRLAAAAGAALAAGFTKKEDEDEPKKHRPKKGKPANPLSETPALPSKGTQASAGAPLLCPPGMGATHLNSRAGYRLPVPLRVISWWRKAVAPGAGGS
jgi:hypothetical protein